MPALTPLTISTCTLVLYPHDNTKLTSGFRRHPIIADRIHVPTSLSYSRSLHPNDRKRSDKRCASIKNNLVLRKHADALNRGFFAARLTTPAHFDFLARREVKMTVAQPSSQCYLMQSQIPWAACSWQPIPSSSVSGIALKFRAE